MILDKNSNIVINCADSPSNIESIIAKAAQEKEVPFISAFVGQETGTITQVYDSQNNYPHNIESEDILSLDASVSVTNMLVGSILAKKLLIIYYKNSFTQIILFIQIKLLILKH